MNSTLYVINKGKKITYLAFLSPTVTDDNVSLIKQALQELGDEDTVKIIKPPIDMDFSAIDFECL